jgi:hypothetical protein
MPVIIPADELRVHASRLLGELKAERDIARRRLARACLQRDLCLWVIAVLLIAIVMMRWVG